LMTVIKILGTELLYHGRSVLCTTAPVPPARLVEDDVAQHEHAPGHRVVGAVGLGAVCIPNEHPWPAAIVKLAHLIQFWAKQRQPNTQTCDTADARSCHVSYGVLPCKLLVAERFSRWTDVTIASSQNFAGMPRYFSKARAMPTTV